MRFFIPHLLIVLCVTSVADAQNSSEREPRAARGRLAWIVYTSMPEGVANPVTVMTGRDILEVALSKRSPSEPVRIPQDGILKIVRESDQPAGSGQTPYLTLAQAYVPEGVNRALIILMPASQPRGDLIFNAKVQDLAKFKGGDWMFLNLTNVQVGVDMGQTSMVMKPGQIQIYDASASAGAELMPIRYRYFHPVQEEWKMLSASTIGIVPTRREICIFSIDPRFQRIEYHGITFPVSN